MAIHLHKFTYTRDDRTISEAWIDNDHTPRQFRLDDRKLLIEKN